MATIKDIAALAQVSSTTVSRVLSQDDTMVVSPEVRTKILNIARELNNASYSGKQEDDNWNSRLADCQKGPSKCKDFILEQNSSDDFV